MLELNFPLSWKLQTYSQYWCRKKKKKSKESYSKPPRRKLWGWLLWWPRNSLQLIWIHELPDVQAGFRKGRGTRDQIANICWIIQKAKEFQKNINFCFIDYAKAFDCVDHNTLWKILKEMGIPDHLTCLLSNLYAGQESTVKTGHGTKDWFQIGKGVRQSCILSPCLFNLHAEYITRNAGLEEAQLESRLLGEISITSDMQMTPPLWQKVKRN